MKYTMIPIRFFLFTPFLNPNAGFDSKNFRESFSKKEINANICFNKRNGNTDRDEYFD